MLFYASDGVDKIPTNKSNNFNFACVQKVYKKDFLCRHFHLVADILALQVDYLCCLTVVNRCKRRRVDGLWSHRNASTEPLTLLYSDHETT